MNKRDTGRRECEAHGEHLIARKNCCNLGVQATTLPSQSCSTRTVVYLPPACWEAMDGGVVMVGGYGRCSVVLLVFGMTRHMI